MLVTSLWGGGIHVDAQHFAAVRVMCLLDCYNHCSKSTEGLSWKLTLFTMCEKITNTHHYQQHSLTELKKCPAANLTYHLIVHFLKKIGMSLQQYISILIWCVTSRRRRMIQSRFESSIQSSKMERLLLETLELNIFFVTFMFSQPWVNIFVALYLSLFPSVTNNPSLLFEYLLCDMHLCFSKWPCLSSLDLENWS